MRALSRIRALILKVGQQTTRTRKMIPSMTKIWMTMTKMPLPTLMHLRPLVVVSNNQPQGVRRSRKSAVASLNHFTFNSSRSRSGWPENRPSFASRSSRMLKMKKKSS